MRHIGTWRPIDRHGGTVAVDRNLDLISFGKKGVESKNEATVSLKQVGDASNYTGCINLLRLEGLHNVEKLIVNVRPVSKLNFDLIQIQKGVFNT